MTSATLLSFIKTTSNRWESVGLRVKTWAYLLNDDREKKKAKGIRVYVRKLQRLHFSW